MAVEIATVINELDDYSSNKKGLFGNRLVSYKDSNFKSDEFITRSYSINNNNKGSLSINVFENIDNVDSITGIFISCETISNSPLVTPVPVLFDFSVVDGTAGEIPLGSLSQFQCMNLTAAPQDYIITNFTLGSTDTIAKLTVILIIKNS